MTVHGAPALGVFNPVQAKRATSLSRRLVLGLGFTLLAATAIGGGAFLRSIPPHGDASVEVAGGPTSSDRTATSPRHPAAAERVAHLRVVAPPVRTAPRLRHAPSARDAVAPRSEATADRHPRLFAAPEPGAAGRFDASRPVRIAAFEAPAAPVAVSSEPRRDPPTLVEAPTLVVEAKPAAATAASAILPGNAEEALEAALIPTPRARPAYRTIMSAPPAAGRARTAAPLLAYARPDAGQDAADDDAAGPKRSLFSRPSVGNGVAIYDIGAATVYMPNGERLEAHSGLGPLRDDVRSAHVKNRGVTPPHTYDLRLRESLFHGVQAIRLTPIGGERQIHNRNGLLAHTYMLGKKGDSNGCVSFKDYKRFLLAFQRGEVRRLVVVKSLNPVSRLASLFDRN